VFESCCVDGEEFDSSGISLVIYLPRSQVETRTSVHDGVLASCVIDLGNKSKHRDPGPGDDETRSLLSGSCPL
jgi:hypothetical protein